MRTTMRWISRRDQLAILAALAAPLLLTLVLVPFRTSFPNTDAALALILVVVAVAAIGHRVAGALAAASAAAWFDFFLTRCAHLTRLLALRSCRFEYGVAGLGRPARLRHDGQLTPGDPSRELEGDGLPPTPSCWRRTTASCRAGSS